MLQEKEKPKSGDAVKRVQEIAQREIERKRKEDEENKKKKKAGGTVDTNPSKGALTRLYEFFYPAKEEKK